MVLTHTPICDFGLTAPDFSLLGIDGKQWTRDECSGENGLLVMFICNHCPYVKSIQDKLVADVKALQAAGVGVVAIMSNDPSDYQEDSYENMQQVVAEKGFTFPYLIDTTQQVAKAYGAVCTPDFFGYNNQNQLQYRGRLDESGKNNNVDNVERELLNAMLGVAKTGQGPQEQVPSMGCSIKWV